MSGSSKRARVAPLLAVALWAFLAPGALGQAPAGLELENVSGAPFADRLVFSRVGSLDSPPPENGVHDRGAVRLRNASAVDVTLTGLSIASPQFVLDPAPALPVVIAPGGEVDVAVRFVASTGNRSNRTRGVYQGTLDVTTDATDDFSVELAGYWQSVSEGGKEPKLVEIVGELYGYDTAILYPGETLNNRGRIEATGEEVISPYWRRADPSRPVTVRQLAAYHSCCENRVPVYWTRKGTENVSLIFRHDGADGQTLLPRKLNTPDPAVAQVTPSVGVFGFRIAGNEYSDPALNDSSPDDCSGGPETCGQHVRFWPVRDRSGRLVPGEFLMVMDYAGINYDFNDNVYLLSNVVPELAPAAPSGLTATGTPDGIGLDWDDNGEADLGGYNVYRSASASGPYALVNGSPVSASDFLDPDVAPGETAFYTVAAVNADGLESARSAGASGTRLEPISDFTVIDWSAVAAQPYANTEAQAATVGGRLYVFGGYDIEKRGAPCNCFTPTARAYVYDPAADAWSPIADLPFPNGGGITHAGIATDGADIFLAGGFYSNETNTGQIIGTREVWRYDVAADTYTPLPDLPVESGSGQLQYLAGQLHYFGGMEGTGAQDEGGAAVGDHYVLDYAAFEAGGSPTWTAAAPLPNPRHHMGSAVLNGRVYAVGGQLGYYGTAVPQASVHAYDPVADVWEARAPLPLARANLAVIAHEGRIIVLGGEFDPPNGNVDDVTAYDPTADTWTELTPLPAERKVGVAGSLDGDLYYTTGAAPPTAETFRGVPDDGVPNAPPVAAFTSSAQGPFAASFDGSGSSDPDGAVAAWRWDFGDGSAADSVSGAQAAHTYGAAGTYAVTLTVTDDEGATASTTQDVTVTEDAPSVVAEAGAVSVTQTDPAAWTAVSFSHVFADPVVVAGPPSYNGTDPSTVRVRNVGPSGFEVRIEEWDYLDGAHGATETIGWLAVEAGVHTLADGRRVEAGRTTADATFAGVGFGTPFDAAPAVLAQVTGEGGGTTVVPRLQNATGSGFEARIQAQEASSAPVDAEGLSWIAVAASASAEAGAAGVAYGVGLTGLTVGDSPVEVPFASAFGAAPVVVAGLQTYVGADPAALRRTSTTGASFAVFAEEEQSGDGETRHAGEAVGWLAAEPGLLQSNQTGPLNTPPEPAFTWEAAQADPLAVSFDGSGSSDPDGAVAAWRWDFGDGSAADSVSGAQAAHTYGAAGTYAVTLTVTDDEGATASVTQDVTVEAPTCEPYSTLECLSVPVSLPFELLFDADRDGLVDAGGVGTGFTVALPASSAVDGPPADPGVPGYAPDSLALDVSAGTLTVAAGDGVFDETAATVPGGNGQRNALAVALDPGGPPFEVYTDLVGLPVRGGAGGERAGVWFGLGEDDLVGLAAVHTGTGYRLRLRAESGAVEAGLVETGDVAASGDLTLKLVLDPAGATATGYYSLDGGATYVEVGPAVAVDAALFAGTGLPDGVTGPVSFAGLLASRGGAPDTLHVAFGAFGVRDVPVVLERPSVSGVSPADGTTELDRDAFIAADVVLPNVGQGIDEATLSDQTVRLYPTGSPAAAVSANLNTSGGGDSIVLQPLELLAPFTPYTFEVTDGLRDLAGQAFEPFTASFTTGGTPTGVPDTDVRFEHVVFDGQGLATEGRHSSLAVGPDGRLYATMINGTLKRWDINPDGTLANAQTILSLRDAEGGNRMAIGLAFDPAATADDLVVWVSHSKFGFSGQPDWGGKIARLSGPDLGTVQNYVVGLPRSIRDHVTNGLAFGPDGALYVLQGSNSAMGAPDDAWGNRPERLLSAAVLRVDVAALAGGTLPLDVKTEEGGTYDPYAPGAPVRVYASGVRNAYDLVWHSNGNLYVPTNGSAANGKAPASEPGVLRPDGAPYAGPVVPAIDSVETQDDLLFRVPPPSAGGTWEHRYYGHPNPARGEFVLNGGNPTALEDPVQVDRYPVSVEPDEAWAGAAYNFGRSISPNGVVEYTGDAFDGALRGKLLVVRYSGGDDVVALAPDGPDGDVAPDGDFELVVEGVPVFNDPLDITEDPATGYLYLSEYGGAGRVSLLRPVEAPNAPPVAAFVSSAQGPLAASFDGSGSSDPDGSVAAWRWDFGDGSAADSVSGAQAAHTYGAAGTYAVTLTVTDDEGATASVTQDVTVDGGLGPYLASGGLAVLEAERAERVARGAHAWEPVVDSAGAVGSAVVASPNTGANENADVETTAPELRWPVRFETGGTYYVWGRVRAATDSDDSFHAGVDGAVSPSASRVTTGGATGGSWVWTRQTMGGGTASVPAVAGDQWVSVWMREDGAAIDRIALSDDPTWTPAGAGPPESRREGDPEPPAALEWATAAPQPYANTEAQAVTVGGRLYVFGGFDILKKQGPCNCFTPTARAYVYDPAADAWSPIADLPFPNGGGVTHAGVTTDGVDIFLASGYISNSAGDGQVFGTKEVWRYDVAADTYTRLPDLPVDRAAGQLQFLGGRLHYFGGTNKARNTDVGDHYVLDYAAFEAGGSPTWTTAATFPNPRHHMGSVVIDGQIYAVGGQKGHDGASVPQASVHSYSPDTDAWTEHAPMPTALSHIAVVLHEGQIVVLGGESEPPSDRVADVTAYDPAANSWAQLTPLPQVRKSGVAGSIDGVLFYSTGANQSGPTRVTYRSTGGGAPSNASPTASFTWSGSGPFEVSLDGSGSSDPDGSVVAWRWDFGDGSPADSVSGAQAAHAYGAAGTYAVTLTVTDDDGATGSVVQQVTVTDGETVVIAEVGVTTVTTSAPSAWTPVPLAGSLTDPVVVAGPPSYNGADPSTVRVRAVGPTGFEVQVDEWDYLDGAHASEGVGWLAVEAGAHVLADGRRVEAGRTTASGSWQSVPFGAPFGSAPVVLATPSASAAAGAVAVRVQNVTASGFEVLVQSQEGSPVPPAEEVSWVAVATGTDGPVAESGTAGVDYGVGRTAEAVGHDPVDVPFAAAFGAAPAVVAGIQTYVGADPAGLRTLSVSAASFETFTEEERSADAEVRHAAEVVGWLAAEPGVLLGSPAAPATLAANAPLLTTGPPPPDEWTIEGVWPNPSRGETQVRYGVPEAGPVAVEVFDSIGRRVAVLADGEQSAGWHQARVDALQLPAGVYIVRLRSGPAVLSHMFTVVR